MKVTVRPAPTSLEDFDAALAAARPLPGMSLPVLQQKWAATAELLRERARFWAEVVQAAEDDAVPIPEVLIEAARLCVAHDKMAAARWETHGDGMAKQR